MSDMPYIKADLAKLIAKWERMGYGRSFHCLRDLARVLKAYRNSR